MDQTTDITPDELLGRDARSLYKEIKSLRAAIELLSKERCEFEKENFKWAEEYHKLELKLAPIVHFCPLCHTPKDVE